MQHDLLTSLPSQGQTQTTLQKRIKGQWSKNQKQNQFILTSDSKVDLSTVCSTTGSSPLWVNVASWPVSSSSYRNEPKCLLICTEVRKPQSDCHIFYKIHQTQLMDKTTVSALMFSKNSSYWVKSPAPTQSPHFAYSCCLVHYKHKTHPLHRFALNRKRRITFTLSLITKVSSGEVHNVLSVCLL